MSHLWQLGDRSRSIINALHIFDMVDDCIQLIMDYSGDCIPDFVCDALKKAKVFFILFYFFFFFGSVV